MDDATIASRIQFAFTLTYHYLFPQLTMSLALMLVIFKTLYLWKGDDRYNIAAQFWAKIFAITFVVGVVTGIPMEFQFGTNWARFSAATGAIIAQTLAMEGAFAFFLESAFLGILLFGERSFGPRVHWLSAVLVWLGTWASGGFIIATNAWMQHPVGYTIQPDGKFALHDYWAVLFNSWIVPEYLHAIGGSVITGSFVLAGLGAYYLLIRRQEEYGKMFCTIGVVVGFIAAALQLFPSGDLEGRQVADHQPAKLAAMEGLFHSESGAGIAILGQPDTTNQRLDNPLIVPKVLSFLTYRNWKARVTGLDSIPRNQWPDNIPFVYFVYHIMVGLGTIFITIMALALLLLWRRRLFESRWMLWLLMLAAPFPFIANSAGWITAEMGRQPWLVYGLQRTVSGTSTMVSAGNVLFTLMGFAGIYLMLGLLYVVLVVQEATRGPHAVESSPDLAEGLTGY
ncbi:MAG TPA: cytochrome ubiquinol oxidase subunit I [Chloroflexota bacterium]|nr:cytochrome ubiquinol oxidase subunit I [Chloroflexota bacterium]